MNGLATLSLFGLCAAGGAAVAGAESLKPHSAASEFWRMPLAAQGDAPASWTPLEQSLAPQDCGACHADQLQQWRQSRHAHAFSAGLVGQLLTFDAPSTAECMQCHAPLAEQRAAFEAARTLGVAHLRERQGLSAAGNACGGCHVRQHRHFGPPQRGTSATGPSATQVPHGGVFRTSFFESSEFCSACHQHSVEMAINGKPLENTYAEWKVSPQAAQGMTCQTCHMPDRRHLWRGIHDPAMVAAGLTARTSVDGIGARFEITNSGVGHAFPTYAVPTVVLHAVAVDAEGRIRADTLRSHVIARRIRYQTNDWVELSDTRLMPGQSAAMTIPWDDSDRVRVWLDVLPDHYYRTQVYSHLLETLPPQSEAAQLIEQAKSEASAARYSLFETVLRRP
jgi:hypothetical protein